MLAGVVALVWLILYTGGFLNTNKVPPGKEAPPPNTEPQPKATARAQQAELEEYFDAVGTLRPRTETTVEAQVSGRVLEVKVRSGDEVKRGQLLVLLDDRRYQAQLGQARQGLAAARAALQRARSEYNRVKKYLAGQAATQRDMERAREVLLSAQARMRQAEKQVEEAAIALGYTRIKAPEDGQVVRRLVEPGDLALPGKPLLVMQTGRVLRLEALVREGLIHQMRLGQTYDVSIPALGKRVKGRVEEIVPSADPMTRTFLVKVSLPPEEGLYSGMFGRLLVPVGKHKVVLAPRRSIIRVGQLEMVRLKTPKGWRRVYVTTGRRVGDKVEVLSGLRGGELLALEGSDA